MKYTRVLLMVVALMVAVAGRGQEHKTALDSLKNANDSMIRVLRTQVQELEVQRIMMREELEKTSEAARNDSLRKALRKQRIDSLRSIIPGVPLVVEGDTLFMLYDRRGGKQPEDRVKDIQESIMQQGTSLTFFVDSVYLYDSDYTTDIMSGGKPIMSVTDNDGLWQNKTRQELAAEYLVIIKNKIDELHREYGMKQKLLGMLYVAGIIVLLGFLIWGTNKLYSRWRLRLMGRLLRRTRQWADKDNQLFNQRRIGGLFLVGLNVMRYVVILLLLLVCIPVLFTAFPATKALAYTIFGYLWNPFVSILKSVAGFLPDFFQIVVIIVCFRYLVKGIRFLMDEIGEGRLKINGFYADWAKPTYYILRLLCYSFMLVMIWPLLPNSNSEIFQGVSVFIGLIVSLGSSSIIGNVMAGMVITYMRPFRVGDFIKYGDTEGFVIEKTVLVTRIRTRKNNVITVPNSSLMGSQTTNFTFSAENYGIVVHTKVTIGYEESWQQIRQLLLDAAKATKGLKQHPEPFVLVTALDDFYVEYEINAYTTQYERLPAIYSELHHNILDSFHTHGVEIMSPHIYAHRQNLALQIPKNQQETSRT